MLVGRPPHGFDGSFVVVETTDRVSVTGGEGGREGRREGGREGRREGGRGGGWWVRDGFDGSIVVVETTDRVSLTKRGRSWRGKGGVIMGVGDGGWSNDESV